MMNAAEEQVSYTLDRIILTFQAPTRQNGQTHWNNSSA